MHESTVPSVPKNLLSRNLGTDHSGPNRLYRMATQWQVHLPGVEDRCETSVWYRLCIHTVRSSCVLCQPGVQIEIVPLVVSEKCPMRPEAFDTFAQIIAVDVPVLRAAGIDHSRTVLAVEFVVEEPELRAVVPDLSRAVLAVALVVQVPALGARFVDVETVLHV